MSGTCTKSQAARIISIRLREELGGTSIAEWKAARQLVFRTTVLALNTEPGMVCSMTHPDMPGGAGEFRVSSWKLNKDYSIDIQGRTTTDSMYDLVAGPKPADVAAAPVPDENLQDNGVPGVVTGTPKLSDYGTFALDQMDVLPDASGNANIVGASEVAMALYYIDELATDLWAKQLLQWWARRVAPVFHARVQFPVAAAMAGGPDALEESPRVIVGTIHSVKGGEADVVFLFPDVSPAGDAAYQKHGPQRDSVIRLFYVGMTRARHTLYICQRESPLAVTI